MPSNRQSRIQVFLKLQNPSQEQATHSASRALAALVLAAFYARPIEVNGKLYAIHLNTSQAWREVKAKVRPNPIKKRQCFDKTKDSGFAHPWSWQPTEGL